MDAIGVVGARNASALGLKFARMIARALTDDHILVASGLARSIDTAAGMKPRFNMQRQPCLRAGSITSTRRKISTCAGRSVIADC